MNAQVTAVAAMVLAAGLYGCRAQPSMVITGGAEALRATVALDKPTVVALEGQEIHVLIRLDALMAAQNQPARRPVINMGLVLDRSGSMAEERKLDYVRRAAVSMIDSLRATDYLSVVEYDDIVSVMRRASPLTSRESVQRLIGQLEPRGSTNLCGGMMKGVDQIMPYVSGERLSRVVLMSDGLANQGITKPEQIAAMVRKARRSGVSVSAIGLGLDYDENLLAAIAENGGGNYYYVESPAQMAAIFRRELSNMQSTVAREIKIRFSGDAIVSGVSAYESQAGVVDGALEIPVAGMYEGEKRTVLVRMAVKSVPKGRQRIGAITLDYFDCTANAQRSLSLPIVIVATADRAAAEKAIDKGASAEALLMRSEYEHEQALVLYERGQKEQAKQQIAQLNSRIAAQNVTLNDTRLAKKAEALSMESAEMDVADQSAQNRSNYVKSTKQRFFYAKQGKQSKYMLADGDRGYEVERLQQTLKDQGLFAGAVDGAFTPALASAVKEYQKRSGLDSDGVAGPATLKSLKLY